MTSPFCVPVTHSAVVNKGGWLLLWNLHLFGKNDKWVSKNFVEQPGVQRSALSKGIVLGSGLWSETQIMQPHEGAGWVLPREIWGIRRGQIIARLISYPRFLGLKAGEWARMQSFNQGSLCCILIRHQGQVLDYGNESMGETRLSCCNLESLSHTLCMAHCT